VIGDFIYLPKMPMSNCLPLNTLKTLQPPCARPSTFSFDPKCGGTTHGFPLQGALVDVGLRFGQPAYQTAVDPWFIVPNTSTPSLHVPAFTNTSKYLHLVLHVFAISTAVINLKTLTCLLYSYTRSHVNIISFCRHFQSTLQGSSILISA